MVNLGISSESHHCAFFPSGGRDIKNEVTLGWEPKEGDLMKVFLYVNNVSFDDSTEQLGRHFLDNRLLAA